MKTKLLILMCMFLFSFAFVSAFSGSGDGSSGNPWQITNCTQLQEMENEYGYFPSTYPYYILMNNIDCADTYNWNGGLGFNPIVPVDAPFGASGGMFYGDFNGQGYTISNLYINRTNENYVAFFRYVANGGTINNVNFDNMMVYGTEDSFVALIAGVYESGSMDSVNVTGEVVGWTGGSGTELIGDTYGMSITNSFFTYQAFTPPEVFVDEPPTVDDIFPTDQDVYTENPIYFYYAFCDDLKIDKVELYLDNVLNTTFLEEDFVYFRYNLCVEDVDNGVWMNLSSGTHTFYFKGYDNSSQATSSDIRTFTLNLPSNTVTPSGSSGGLKMEQLPTEEQSPISKISIFSSIGNFFRNILNWFKNIF